MSTTASKPLVIHKPGDKDYCPSCDRAGLAILVTLFGVIPTQNYAQAAASGYDWVSYMEPDSNPMFGSFDRTGYLAKRKLADSHTEGSLNCSHYVVRRLRKGFLYVYYPQDKSWDYYATQTNGRLERMQGDLHHGLGRSDAACARFAASPSNLLLTIDDPQKHPDFWIAFSEAPWTQTVRNQVAANPSEFMQHIKIASDLVAFDGADLIKGTVLGFQEKPLPHSNDRLAYPCTPQDSPSDAYQALAAHNAPFKATGLMLALQDDIGITTQLAFERNGAFLDIVGEGKGYSPDDRNRMDTAGLIEQLETVVGADQFARMEKHLKVADYKKYLAKYHRCRDARVDFASYSHDYIVWMQHTLARKHWQLFDPAVPEIGAHLGRCTANLFEGCGLTKQEFEQILKPQLEADANDPTQLFWRGAAANNAALLAVLANGALGKTLEALKQGDSVASQLDYLKEVHAAKDTAAALNKASWSRLARVIASHARQLREADAKTFRRTMRRVQALTLTEANQVVIEHTVDGSAAEYLKQLQLGMDDAKGRIRRTPKNVGETAALAELMVATWKPGDPAPPNFLEALKEIGVSADELPPSTTVEVSHVEVKPMWLKATVGLNAGMATLQIMAFVESVHALGLDLGHAVQGQNPGLLRLTKDFGETGASLIGAASSGYETAAVLTQLAADGTKTTQFWQLTWMAGKLGLVAAGVQFVVGVSDAVDLWESGDHMAGGVKGGAAALGAIGAGVGYWGIRLAARTALEAAARKAALGVAGELAAETEAAAAITSGAALGPGEGIPPAAAVALIVSAVLFVFSIGFDFWSKHFVTTPFEKWADRSFLGQRSGKWGRGDISMKEQLGELLRVLYAVTVEGPSLLSFEHAMTVSVPAFGEASKLVIKIDSQHYAIGYYIIENLKEGVTPVLQNLARPARDLAIQTHVEREGAGLKMQIRMGGAAAALGQEAMLAGAALAENLLGGLPTAQAFYYPNEAAYPWFYVEGGSVEKAADRKDATK